MRRRAVNAGVDVSVVSSAHHVGDGRLHRICRALHQEGLTTEVVAKGEPCSAPATAAFHALDPAPGLPARLRRARSALVAARGSCVLVLDPDLAVLGLFDRALRRRCLVVDVHEDYVAVASDRGLGPVARHAARAAARVATACAARADLTAVADDHVPPRQARSRLVVRNVAVLDELPPPADPDAAGRSRRAVYVGDVRPSRGLYEMVDGVLGTRDWSLDVVGPVRDADRAWLDARLNRPDGARVRLHGRLPHPEAWEVAGQAAVGLVLSHDTPAFRDAMPTKLYEYLAMGMAVVGSALPRVRGVLDESGAGVLAVSSTDVTSILELWANQPHVLDEHRRRASTWAAARLGGPSPFQELAAAIRLLI